MFLQSEITNRWFNKTQFQEWNTVKDIPPTNTVGFRMAVMAVTCLKP
jgi:hypothetical protein